MAKAEGEDHDALGAEIELDAATGAPFPWRAVLKRGLGLAVAGIAIYLVFPAVLSVLDAWPRLRTLDPLWFIVAAVAELAHFACTFSLQRIALRTKAWFSVITAQLAGNSISLIVPGGAAAGAAMQFRMLDQSGLDSTDTVGGLTAFSLLGIGGLLALPLFALPVILAGSPVARGLYNAVLLGSLGFVLFAGFSASFLVFDWPLRWCGEAAQSIRNKVLRRRPPVTDLPETLLRQRNMIKEVLGKQWKEAVLLSAGRLGFDYLCLLAAIRATGSSPRPSLVMVAYAAAGIIGMIPITPGGLGVVEASLTGLLILAGVDASNAVLATLTYRLASYWAPLAAGPIAYGAFRHRYRGRVGPNDPPGLGATPGSA